MPSPAGKRLDDGHSTTLLFSLNNTIQLWERTVKPPGVDSGGSNDTTNMRNVTWRTMIGKHLKTLTPMTLKCGYDEAVISNIIAIAGKNQQITVNYPTGRPLTFWGVLDKFEPDDLTEGSPVTGTVTIFPTNQDNTGTEAGPTVGTSTTSTATTTS